MREDEKHRPRNNICCMLEGNPLWHVDYLLEMCTVCRAVLDKRCLERHLLEGVLLQTFQKVIVVCHDLIGLTRHLSHR